MHSLLARAAACVLPAQPLSCVEIAVPHCQDGQVCIWPYACRWQLRIESVREARRAYARSLHLQPTSAGAWGDVGASFYLESQLRRAHPVLAVTDASGLRAASERAVRGATRPCALLACFLQRHHELETA